MTRHSDPVGSAFGVGGVVVLFVLLAGFVAMHGVASTTSSGVHHSGITLIGGAGHDAAAREPAAPMSSMAGAAGDSGDPHGLMTGCLLVLCGIAVAVALRLFRRVRTAVCSRTGAWVGLGAPHPARPPPRRYRLALCVLRV